MNKHRIDIGKMVQRCVFLLMLPTILAGAVHAVPQKTKLSEIDLIAEAASLTTDGGVITLGFRLTPDEGWHAYWRNPGDAGKAAQIDWTLPDNFSVGELRFPTPHLIPFGELNTYGYEQSILLLTDVSYPAGLTIGDSIELLGRADWVVCDDELCVPEKANVEITLTVGNGGHNPETAQQFEAARAHLPEAVDWNAVFENTGDKVNIAISTPFEITDADSIYMFPGAQNTVKYNEQVVAFAPQGLVVTMNADRKAGEQATLPVVLTFDDDAGERQAVELTAVAGDASALAMASTGRKSGGFGGLNSFTALLFAFLGGVVLNLMPCVLPILSMKALSLVKLSHGDQQLARQSGALYTLGVLIAFGAIGLALLLLRLGGEAIGWGFQMQYPLVNLGLAMLMIAIALNLMGVFEIGGRLIGAGENLTSGGERRSAFFTGLLAVLVATPCTAPFMAAALGFALIQPPVITMLIFLSLGFGLAFPYLLLSHSPALEKFLPKPGAWMNTFKSLLAFPLFGTAIWLLWVMGKQTGVDAMAMGLIAFLLIAIAAYCWGRTAMAEKPLGWRAASIVALVAAAFMAVGVNGSGSRSSAAKSSDDEERLLGGLEIETFTPARVARYVEAGEPAFVYFTADWCVSCKVNERVTLASSAVGDAFRERGIRVIEGDWTNQNPDITAWLQKFGRIGVPLYLYFPEGGDLDAPVILPQVLTPGLVIATTGK